ncbi:MAG: HPP family protein [Oscillospiraceae bacterium]|jgi:CBS-domain-containing membrane protein|nr:HPP family protein [Oscillospiraceae bacterium]
MASNSGVKTDAPNKKTRGHRLRILLQSLAAGCFILIVFMVSDLLGCGAVAASVGASTMIVFAYPNAESSRCRYLIGGYATACAAGFLCNRALYVTPIEILPLPPYILISALAVFLTVLLMVILDFQHPPAAALTIIITLSDKPVTALVQALVCILLLSGIKFVLRKRLTNL